MINKIIVSIFFVCLLIAIPLSLAGIEKVELGEPFLNFMSTCNDELSRFKIAIPDIPLIPQYGNADGFQFVLNLLISFVNMIVKIVNIIADIINIVIQLIQFIVIVVKNLILFKDNLKNYAIPVS